jgi:hypothetical protein
MHRLFATVFVAGLVATTAIAAADDYRSAGTRGTVTAYELDGRTVVSHKFCTRTGKYTFDYVRCSEWLRESVKLSLCNRLGSGTHHYLYQLGDERPIRSTVFCPSRRY